jgi:hypothetical protein
MRPIVEGVVEGEESEVQSGLQPGEVVVLMGTDRLEEGSPVRAQIEGEGGRGGRGGRQSADAAAQPGAPPAEGRRGTQQ